MFPEITRDEVFRIETPRLWLRWPALADATALAGLMAKFCRHAGSGLALANAQGVETLIGQWRAEMEAGLGLHLVLVPKTGARLPVGMIHLSPSRPARLAPETGLGETGTEALRALSAMADMLGIGPSPDPVPEAGVLLRGIQRAAPSGLAGFCR